MDVLQGHRGSQAEAEAGLGSHDQHVGQGVLDRGKKGDAFSGGSGVLDRSIDKWIMIRERFTV